MRRPRSWRSWRVRASLLASVLLHLLLLWAWTRWAEEPVHRLLRPTRMELAPALSTQRFEPLPQAAAPGISMEQLRAPAAAEPVPPTDLGETPPAPPDLAPDQAPTLGGTEREPAAETLEPRRGAGDPETQRLTQSVDRYRWRLPLSDTTGSAAQRRSRADDIIERAIRAMGGLQRLQGLRDLRIRIERWDDGRSRWVPAGQRAYLRGRYGRHDIAAGIARGYDGQRSWSFRHGLHLPPRDERYAAARWDFLTRFRGDGVWAEHVDRRNTPRGQVDVVRVVDAAFHRERLAAFDVRTGLLRQEIDGADTLFFVEHRDAGGLLLPHEVWQQRVLLTRYRWNTEINVGLTATDFAAPPEMDWAAADVRSVLFEHATPPTDGVLRLAAGDLTQARVTDGRLDGMGSYLLDTFVKRKLERAGVLVPMETADLRLLWRVEEYRVIVLPSGWRVATLDLGVTVQDLTADRPLWQDRFQERWSFEGDAIDARRADMLSYRVLSRLSAGLAQLQGRAQVQPAPSVPPPDTP